MQLGFKFWRPCLLPYFSSINQRFSIRTKTYTSFLVRCVCDSFCCSICNITHKNFTSKNVRNLQSSINGFLWSPKKKPVSLDLLILAVLWYLGRGWTIDDLVEATTISYETIRLFLHRFSIPQINTILINTQMSASSHKLVHLMLNIEYQILKTKKMSSQYSIFMR